MSTATASAGRLPRLGIRNRAVILLASTLWPTVVIPATAPDDGRDGGPDGAAAVSEERGAGETRRPGDGSELDARRVIGKAYYENAETPPQFAPAANEFRRCLELAPDSAIDRFNLGLTLMRGERFEEALEVLNEARRLDPELLAATYVSGIVYKRLSRLQKAIECLRRVTQRDPQCAGAYYNLGVCYKQLKEREKAVAAFVRAVELRPTHPSYHYQLMILYRDLGEVDDVKRHKETFDRVKNTIDESEKTAEALERSRYSYIIEAPKLTGDLTPNLGAKVRFVEVTLDGWDTHQDNFAKVAGLSLDARSHFA